MIIPMKPTKTANHLYNPTFSFNKKIENIVVNIGAAKVMLTTVAKGKFLKAINIDTNAINPAKQVLNKKFNPKLISKMSDEDAIIYLSQLKQIGRWSAEMILLFTYNRPNIWPVQDIGLLRGISKNYNKKYLPPERYIKFLKKRFSPYCSVATWYLWRSIDPEPIQY